MKLLHIADLHIGKRLHEYDLSEDQIFALNKIVDIAKDKQVDAVLIAGDVYQTTTPSSEAMMIFNNFVTKLVENKIKVFVISGNHDSGEKISYFSALIENAGVYVSEKFEGKYKTITLDDEYGPVNIHLLPFIKPIDVKHAYKQDKTSTYQDALTMVVENNPIDTDERNVLLMHQFITGSEKGGSEEMMVGTLENIDGMLFKDFDYVALGHIHKGQHVLFDNIRYSGSLLKYAISETKNKPAAVYVELNEKGNTTIEKIEYETKRDVKVVEGLLADLKKKPRDDDYVQIILHDEDVDPDAHYVLACVYPNVLNIRIENSRTSTSVEMNFDESIQGKGINELFSDFYKQMNNNTDLTEAQLKIVNEIIEEMKGE